MCDSLWLIADRTLLGTVWSHCNAPVVFLLRKLLPCCKDFMLMAMNLLLFHSDPFDGGLRRVLKQPVPTPLDKMKLDGYREHMSQQCATCLTWCITSTMAGSL